MRSMVEGAATRTGAPYPHRVRTRPLHRLPAVPLPRGFATGEEPDCGIVPAGCHP